MMLNATNQILEKSKSRERTNNEWVVELSQSGPTQGDAIEALRGHLLRAVMSYLGRQGNRLQRYSWADLEHTAEDFAQDALLKILDNLHSFEGRSRFTTWAMRIAINTAASELRRTLWQEVSLIGTDEEGEESSLVSVLGAEDKEGSPEAAAQRQEAIDLLRKIIKSELTERQRVVMLNVLIHGMPLDVVADRMNTNRNNIYKITHDARLKLRSSLMEAGLTTDYVISLFGEKR